MHDFEIEPRTVAVRGELHFARDTIERDLSMRDGAMDFCLTELYLSEFRV